VNVVRGLESFRLGGRPVCVALGTFDGVHRGHRAIIDTVRAAAAARGGEALATTFDPHPLKVIAPPSEPFLLSTLDERLLLFERAGVDGVVVIRFDATLRGVEAREWLDMIGGRLRARHLVVSSNHTFGKNRQGTIGVLREWAAARDVEIAVVPAVRDGDEAISSSAIRDRLRRGDVRQAATWLGRHYSVSGTVVEGEGRGRRLGIPTANVSVPEDKLVPARGVYAAYATVRGTTHPAAVNIGVRPTFGASTRTVEAHLIDADVALYGEVLTLAFADRLRDEVSFDGPAALVRQIQTDIAAARRVLGTVDMSSEVL
jgi:riboflavin kinase/FMN adenylyltransferase